MSVHHTCLQYDIMYVTYMPITWSYYLPVDLKIRQNTDIDIYCVASDDVERVFTVGFKVRHHCEFGLFGQNVCPEFLRWHKLHGD